MKSISVHERFVHIKKNQDRSDVLYLMVVLCCASGNRRLKACIFNGYKQNALE